jgi:hypothetical protein
MYSLQLCNIIAQKVYNIKEINILTNKITDLGLADGREKLRKNMKSVKTVSV